SRALRRLGPRQPLVARPDGADDDAPGRADGARLARLVRDLERRGRLAAADDPPEPTVPRARARLVPPPAARGDPRPGDAALALGLGQQPLLAERELRARADGALHARPRFGLHRGGRAPASPSADRLSQRLEPLEGPRPLSLRPELPRSGDEADLPQARPLRLARLVPALPHASRASEVLRHEALELLRPDGAAARDARRARAPLRRFRLRGPARGRGD